MELQYLETNVQDGPGSPIQKEADALYRKSLQHLQDGQWQEAIAGFQQVLQLCPDHTEAEALLEETRVKASLEQHKPKPKQLRFRLPGPVKYAALALLVLSVVLFGVVTLRWAYSRWVEPMRATQRAELLKAQQLEQAYKYLAERDYTAAEEAFRQLLAQDPDNQEAQKGLAEVQKKVALAENYAEAEQAIAAQDWDKAWRLLEAIAAQDPGYKDVQAKRAFVQEQQQLSAYFDQAEKAYHAGDWQTAISAYEKLRNLDTEYQKTAVTEHLFACYLQQGLQLVQSTRGKTEAVREAQSLYQKALTLQPQQPQAIRELALAEKYLEGQTLLAKGDSLGAKAALEWVCQQQPDYASGNAAALLKAAGGGESLATPTPMVVSTVPIVEGNFREQYARSMQKGDEALAAGDHAQAEQYYGQATAIAIHGGLNSARWLFASYAKLGTARARSGSYEQAVETIKTAISIMTKSATAIPASSYADYVEQGDRYAQEKDYPKAFAQYEKAVQAISQKCNCGLEDWSILP